MYTVRQPSPGDGGCPPDNGGGSRLRTSLPRAAEAIPFLERALEAGPRSTVALNSLGFARLEAGDAPGGLAALRGSLALDPGQPRIAEVVADLTRADHASAGRRRRER